MGGPIANSLRLRFTLGRAEAIVVLSFIRAPADFNLWEEEETQPLHLLLGNLIMDCRFRRSGAVSFLRSICRTRPLSAHLRDCGGRQGGPQRTPRAHRDL